MIVVGSREYRTLKDEMFVNGSKVYEVYVNGTKVYPDGFVGDEVIITLSWGTDPSDLDSHVTTSYFHVYYGNKVYQGEHGGGTNETAECWLDVDDTSSYGPEHTTIHPVSGVEYTFYVHHYSGKGTIATSDAVVTIESNGQLIDTFNPPSGSYMNWYVFTLQDGVITPLNTTS